MYLTGRWHSLSAGLGPWFCSISLSIKSQEDGRVETAAVGLEHPDPALVLNGEDVLFLLPGTPAPSPTQECLSPHLWSWDVLGGGLWMFLGEEVIGSRGAPTSFSSARRFSLRAHISSWNALSCSSLAASILRSHWCCFCHCSTWLLISSSFLSKACTCSGAHGEEGDARPATQILSIPNKVGGTFLWKIRWEYFISGGQQRATLL